MNFFKIRSNKKLQGSFLVVIGFILSPFSWWNDIFVNIPLSWLLASLVSSLWPGVFKASFIIFYWLTNVAGIILMHLGKNRFQNRMTRMKLIDILLIALLYTAGIILLVQNKILQPIHLPLFK